MLKEQITKWLKIYLRSNRNAGRRRKLNIQSLEDELIHLKIRDRILYQEQNGYQHFVQAIRELHKDGKLAPVKASPLNGRNPALHTQWWVLPEVKPSLWTNMQMLRIADQLNLSRYRQQPDLQTEEEWQRLLKIYHFLKHKDLYTWVTREERAFQLFGDEKFFTGEGSILLQRLQITLDDLKAKVYGEPFVFWPSTTCNMQALHSVLIVENLSFYHTCRSLMNRGLPIVGIHPDLLIYGEGKKIEHSLSFLREFPNSSGAALLYAGDMDPEGWGIYVRLKESYPEYQIKLAIPIYQAMVRRQLTNNTDEGQTQNEMYLNQVICELLELEHQELSEVVRRCWQEGTRIPQEVLSLDSLPMQAK